MGADGPPVVPATGKRFGLNLSAVSPQGVLRFMVVDGRMTAVRFIAFLKRLLHNQTQPIFLIVDQHSSHRAKAVQEFVASDGHLELFFLPPYSPELNPELVWNHLKHTGFANACCRRRRNSLRPRPDSGRPVAFLQEAEWMVTILMRSPPSG